MNAEQDTQRIRAIIDDDVGRSQHRRREEDSESVLGR